MSVNLGVPHDDRPQLVGVSVPWYVAGRRANLAVACYADSQDRHTQVGFRGLWLRERGDGPFELHVMRLTFANALAARLIRADGEPFGFDPTDYKTADEPKTSDIACDNLDLAHGVQGLEAHWRATGICPACNFYEVLRSDWMQELAADEDDQKHYLLADAHARVDVIATGWRWESVERLGEVDSIWMV